VSGTNEVSDGNETNNPTEVSDGNETNNPTAVKSSERNEPVKSNATRGETQHPHEPHIQILKGRPNDRELAALIAVLGSARSSPEPAPPPHTRWGLPVDKLRFAITNHQRVTLQARKHMER
jgi:hypothetical protein